MSDVDDDPAGSRAPASGAPAVADEAPKPRGPRHVLAWLLLGALRLVIPLALLAGGVMAARVLVTTRAAPERAEREPQPTVVETMVAEATSRRAVVEAYGTVQPHRRLVVRAQVSGLVLEQHPELIAGGLLEAGSLLVRLDPRDYDFRVQEEEAALVRAEFELALEEGRQLVAAREWTLLGDSVERTELGEELALRRPHLREKQAAAKAARSRLDRARLDRDRTRIDVPFNAIVLSESVEPGQLVDLQTAIAELACVDDFHVQVNLPVSRLDLVVLPDAAGEGGSSVEILNELGAGRVHRYPGRVVRLLGDVDPAGRMARLLVQVDDPLQLGTDGPVAEGVERVDRPPLLLGEFVRARIAGPQAGRVVALPRRALREGDRVWVMDEAGRLDVRDVAIAWGDDDDVVLASGVEPGERIVTSSLAAPVPGMPLVDLAETETPVAAAGDADRARREGEAP